MIDIRDLMETMFTLKIEHLEGKYYALNCKAKDFESSCNMSREQMTTLKFNCEVLARALRSVLNAYSD